VVEKPIQNEVSENAKKTAAIDAARHREQKGSHRWSKKEGIAENRTPVVRWYRS
jgi:hypothetical protein